MTARRFDHPLGVEIDTEYLYRLQGSESTAASTAAISSPSTHHQSQRPCPENAAACAAIVDVSSEFYEAFGAADAVAGDLATEWSSGGDGDEAYLVIDLGREVDVVAVGFHTRSMSDGTATTETSPSPSTTPTPTGPSPWDAPMSVSPGRSCVSTSTRRAVGTPDPRRSRFSKVRDAASAGNGRCLYHPSQVDNEGCCQGET